MKNEQKNTKFYKNHLNFSLGFLENQRVPSKIPKHTI